MGRVTLAVAALCFVLVSWSEARSQVTLDVSKITCEQFAYYKIVDPRYIALWLNGYFNSKKDNTVIDTQGLIANVTKLTEYCRANPEVMVMKAASGVFNVND
jgi:hypothetical protein